MPPLSFSLNFKTQELRSIDLPIEIRKPNSTLVKRTLASQTVDLPPGSYYGTAILPGGQRLLHPFEMRDQPVVLTLEPDADDESPHEWEETSHYLQAARSWARKEAPAPSALRDSSPAASASDPAPPATVRAWLRFFSGNVVDGTAQVTSVRAHATVDNFEQGRIVQFRVRGTDGPFVAQLLEPGVPARNMAIPLAPFGEALLVFTRREDGGCAMEAHLLNNTADLLLRYCVTATLAAGVTVQSRLLDAESLLSEKDADPVAAAVAAGAILSYGELQWLHDWTERLDLRFSWLPDGAAIHAEHLARRGRHVEAAARFFEVPMRGLPVLGDALVFTIERLKWYSSLNPQHAQGIDVNRAADALAKLNPFGLAAHRGRPVTSYSGLDPRQPSQDLWDGLQMPADSVDLAEWLGEGGTRNVRGGGGALSNAPTIYAPPAIVSSR